MYLTAAYCNIRALSPLVTPIERHTACPSSSSSRHSNTHAIPSLSSPTSSSSSSVYIRGTSVPPFHLSTTKPTSFHIHRRHRSSLHLLHKSTQKSLGRKSTTKVDMPSTSTGSPSSLALPLPHTFTSTSSFLTFIDSSTTPTIEMKIDEPRRSLLSNPPLDPPPTSTSTSTSTLTSTSTAVVAVTDPREIAPPLTVQQNHCSTFHLVSPKQVVVHAPVLVGEVLKDITERLKAFQCSSTSSSSSISKKGSLSSPFHWNQLKAKKKINAKEKKIKNLKLEITSKTRIIEEMKTRYTRL
ncbi:hypothetical protein HMI55_003237 [Coelomomyces lativittatus]|nr:hypothetical protein HMI55_003237 [Coelomomyces lativittatus]